MYLLSKVEGRKTLDLSLLTFVFLCCKDTYIFYAWAKVVVEKGMTFSKQLSL